MVSSILKKTFNQGADIEEDFDDISEEALLTRSVKKPDNPTTPTAAAVTRKSAITSMSTSIDVMAGLNPERASDAAQHTKKTSDKAKSDDVTETQSKVTSPDESSKYNGYAEKTVEILRKQSMSFNSVYDDQSEQWIANTQKAIDAANLLLKKGQISAANKMMLDELLKLVILQSTDLKENKDSSTSSNAITPPSSIDSKPVHADLALDTLQNHQVVDAARTNVDALQTAADNVNSQPLSNASSQRESQYDTVLKVVSGTSEPSVHSRLRVNPSLINGERTAMLGKCLPLTNWIKESHIVPTPNTESDGHAIHKLRRNGELHDYGDKLDMNGLNKKENAKTAIEFARRQNWNMIAVSGNALFMDQVQKLGKKYGIEVLPVDERISSYSLKYDLDAATISSSKLNNSPSPTAVPADTQNLAMDGNHASQILNKQRTNVPSMK